MMINILLHVVQDIIVVYIYIYNFNDSLKFMENNKLTVNKYEIVREYEYPQCKKGKSLFADKILSGSVK